MKLIDIINEIKSNNNLSKERLIELIELSFQKGVEAKDKSIKENLEKYKKDNNIEGVFLDWETIL